MPDHLTDRECLLQIIQRLGLKRHEREDQRGCMLSSDEWSEPEPGVIAIGSGPEGYCSFFAEFQFDSEGKAVSHGIWE
jgi:hypothetical protein